MLHFIRTNLWLVLVVTAAVIALMIFVDPAPPREITIATGEKEGAYHRFGEQLARELRKEGLEVKLQATKGSIENLELLNAGDNEVSIALVQSGIPAEDDSSLRSLGSLFYEPVWVFHNKALKLETLKDLAGLRASVGTEGSGTLPVAMDVLRSSGLMDGAGDSVELVNLGSNDAATALLDGSIDVAILVASPSSPVVRELNREPSITFFGLKRRQAYQAAFPKLTTLLIGEGQLDIANNIPDSDRPMLASAVTLVVNDRFHPGLTPLILESCADLMGEGGILEPPDTFPAPRPTDYPLLAEADHFFRYGPSWLTRTLPFFVATVVFRIIILVIPMLALLIPLMKVAPPLYKWRTRQKIFKWYKNLREIDQKIFNGEIRKTLDEDLAGLRKLEGEIFGVQVPLSYSDELYQLHVHIESVIARLERMRDERPPADGSTAGTAS